MFGSFRLAGLVALLTGNFFFHLIWLYILYPVFLLHVYGYVYSPVWCMSHIWQIFCILRVSFLQRLIGHPFPPMWCLTAWEDYKISTSWLNGRCQQWVLNIVWQPWCQAEGSLSGIIFNICSQKGIGCIVLLLCAFFWLMRSWQWATNHCFVQSKYRTFAPESGLSA